MAISAAAGAVGLAGGGIDFGEPITSRLPFHSYPLAGAALLLSVAVPMGVAAVAAAREHPRAGTIALTSGALLIGWIVVQLAVIRTYVWLQPACIAWGLTVMALGWRLRRSRPR
jgi:hypothetical protein